MGSNPGYLLKSFLFKKNPANYLVQVSFGYFLRTPVLQRLEKHCRVQQQFYCLAQQASTENDPICVDNNHRRSLKAAKIGNLLQSQQEDKLLGKPCCWPSRCSVRLTNGASMAKGQSLSRQELPQTRRRRTLFGFLVKTHKVSTVFPHIVSAETILF